MDRSYQASEGWQGLMEYRRRTVCDTYSEVCFDIYGWAFLFTFELYGSDYLLLFYYLISIS
jgi:hypothetical protein